MKTTTPPFDPSKIRYLAVKTTDQGPFVEDVFYIVVTDDNIELITMSEGNEIVDIMQSLPGVDYETFIKSMGSAENRLTIVYRRKEFSIESYNQEPYLLKRLSAFLMQHLKGDKEHITKLAFSLIESYKEPHRFYHGLEHIAWSLRELDNLVHLNLNKAKLELAIWYHDSHYRPLSNKNERQSAKRMLKELNPFESTLEIKQISEWIKNPTQHDSKNNAPWSEEQKVFHDIDFSVFGRHFLEYNVYVQNVRSEYSAVPDWIFNVKRRRFLKRLQQDGVFYSSHFKNNCEALAQKNIGSELDRAKSF